MKREIKFRAFIKDYGEMYSVISVFRKSVDEDFQRIFIDKEAAEGHPANYRVGDGVYLMQFTGLLDKNRKEIYEGDILRHTTLGHVSIASWSNLTMANVIQFPYFEVIGNIYENPELLK